MVPVLKYLILKQERQTHAQTHTHVHTHEATEGVLTSFENKWLREHYKFIRWAHRHGKL